MTQHNPFFHAISTAKRASQIANDQAGRIPYPILSSVTNNQDPENLRRVKAVDPVCKDLETHWLRRAHPPFVDGPLPPVGATILVWFIDGVAKNGWYFPVQNTTNPPLEKEDPINDYRERVPGEHISEVGANRTERTLITHKISAGQDVRVELDNGSYVDMKLDGSIEIVNKLGAYYKLTAEGMVDISNVVGAGALFDLAGQCNLFATNINLLPPRGSTSTAPTIVSMGGRTLRLDDGSMVMTNMDDVKINTKDVLTVGSVDSDGDVSQTKGWS